MKVEELLLSLLKRNQELEEEIKALRSNEKPEPEPEPEAESPNLEDLLASLSESDESSKEPSLEEQRALLVAKLKSAPREEKKEIREQIKLLTKI